MSRADRPEGEAGLASWLASYPMSKYCRTLAWLSGFEPPGEQN